MNERKIEISLERTDKEKIFEVNDENLGRVTITVPDGDKVKVLSGYQYHVILEMSKDAMIGFATELLRMAYEKDEDSFNELTPSDSTFVSQCMGIVLKPDSCRLSVSKQNLGNIKDI